MPGASIPGELHAFLRAATRTGHHRIDHHPLLAPLVRPGLTRARYAQVLLVFLEIYSSLQPALAAALTQLDRSGDYDPGDRIAWLQADLRALGCATTLAPREWLAPPLSSAAALVGSLYVIEGSTQGGQVIYRQLQQSLGIDASSGARFFHGWGNASGQRWEEFWRFAAATCPAGGETGAASAAVALFDAIERGLDAALARQPAEEPEETHVG